MNSAILPPLSNENLNLAHFPTTMQALIFRVWEMIPAKKIADVLKTTEKNVAMLAEQLGLLPQKDLADWLNVGYITIIRSCWHILPYHQLTELLGWDDKKLAFILKEDDFLGHKLGDSKPRCDDVIYRELTDLERCQTEKIKKYMDNYVRKYDKENSSQPFDLFYALDKGQYKKKEKPIDFDVEITSKWSIVDQTQNSEALPFINRFLSEYNDLWNVELQYSGTKNHSSIVLKIDANLKHKITEYHEIKISPDDIEIVATDARGILRGLNYLVNLSKLAYGPYYNSSFYERKPNLETRFIYSFCGLYGNSFDCDSKISHPDSLLYEYSKLGINGIWLPAVLYKMVEFQFEPTISDGWQKRINNLNELVERANEYGISVYLYINEPRTMPINFFKKYPQLQGHTDGDYACMCTSAPETLDYLRGAITKICTAVPNLGGFFTITCSENLTNCYSHMTEETQDCPLCKKRIAIDVIAEVNSVIADSAYNVNPKIKTFVWTWAWIAQLKSLENIYACIDKISKNATIMCVSEEKLDFTIAGIQSSVIDYTMSLIGPSAQSKSVFAKAKEAGLQTVAKVQINTTWECSTAPYIPVFESVIKHMKNLIECGVNHIMLSWTLGGYPSQNLKIASDFFFCDTSPNIYENALKREYGENYLTVQKAVSTFCDAFSEFPFNIETIYTGPSNGGPSNLLFENPTNLNATMTCYSYDDLETWRSIYPTDIFENQFKLLCNKWLSGLKILEKMPSCELRDMSYICYALFKSSYNQIRFVRLRNEFLKSKCEAEKIKIIDIVNDELSIAISTYRIMLKNPAIGYEAANHYYFNRTMITEKIVCCKYLLEKYMRDTNA